MGDDPLHHSAKQTASDLVDPTREYPKTSKLVDFTSQITYGLTTYEELLSIENEDTNSWTYQPGNIVMEEIPYASVVSLNCASSLCHSCYKPEQLEVKLKRCARCRFARYCDDSCAKKAWAIHKMECSLLAKYLTAVSFFPDALIRLVNLVMIKVWKGQMTMPKESCFPPTDREFDSLCSHTSEIDEELEKSEKFRTNMQEIKSFMGADVLLEIGEDIVAEVYSRVVTNTISICDREGNQMGIGLYFGISQFDHSCVPNAIYFARESAPQVQIVALAPIQSLSQVKIAYVDPMKPTQHRRAELKESYYFSCSCSRCHAIERDGMTRSLSCPNKRCDGFVLLAKDWLPLGPCGKCDAHLDHSETSLKDGKELMLTIDDFIDANANALLFATGSAPDPQLIQLLLGLEQVASITLFKLNYFRLRLDTCLVHYHTLVCGNLTKSLSLQADLVEAYKFNLGPVSMPAFLALMDAARWYLTLADWVGLRKVVVEAKRMAGIIYHPKDPFQKELSSLLDLSHAKSLSML